MQFMTYKSRINLTYNVISVLILHYASKKKKIKVYFKEKYQDIMKKSKRNSLKETFIIFGIVIYYFFNQPINQSINIYQICIF